MLFQIEFNKYLICLVLFPKKKKNIFKNVFLLYIIQYFLLNDVDYNTIS